MVEDSHHKSIPDDVLQFDPSILLGCLVQYINILSQDLPCIHLNVMKKYESIFTEAEKTEI